MKKLYMALLIILIAGYWGYQEGKTLPIKPTGHRETQFSTDIQALTGNIKNRLANHISSKDTETDSTKSEKKEKDSPSLINRYQRIRHFKNAVETTIDRNTFAPIDTIPQYLQEGLIATEDRRFYDHGAIDLIGVTRALVMNIMADRTVEGGSTLSQQTVKTLFLTPERTLLRKGEELLLAMELETHYTKKEILEIYLNTVYFGHGAYGIQEAAHTYFRKEVEQLNLSECAMLAGLPQAPSAYDPLLYQEEGLRRMKEVLNNMVKEKYITKEDALRAMEEFRIAPQ